MLLSYFDKLSLQRGLLLVLLCSTLFFGFRLGSYPLFVPDEARYSEIPREMLVTQDFITPRLDGIKYLEKPPLFYWMQTVGLSILGINPWGARIASAFLGVLGCMLIYMAGFRLFSPRAGAWSAVILATSLLYFGLVHIVTLDLSLTFFVTTALLAFIAVQKYPMGITRRLLCYAGFLSGALAVLAKGLIGVVLPGLIIFCWMLIRLNFQSLRGLYWPTGILLFLLVAVPWHYLEQQANPEFFNYYFIEHHFKRYATDYAQRYQPWWFFGVVFVLGTLPWSLFFPKFLNRESLKTAWQLLRTSPTESFLLCWMIIPILFFSISQSKLVPYILPSFPPFALLLGRWLSHFSAQSQQVRVATYAAGISATLLLITTWIFPFANPKSTYDFAQIIKPTLKEGNLVITYQHFYYDLPFYLQHLIPFVWHGGELRYGTAFSVVPHLVFDRERFFNFVKKTKHPIWVIVKNDDFTEFQYFMRTPYEIRATSSRDKLLYIKPKVPNTLSTKPHS